MKRFSLRLFLFILAVGLLSQPPVMAQVQVRQGVLGNVATDLAIGSGQIRGTGGQSAIGVVTSTSHVTESGFWYGYLAGQGPETDGAIFAEDFNTYVIGSTGTQYETGLPVHAFGSVPGWTGGGINHSHAVDLDPGTGDDFALQLFNGTTVSNGNTLTLDTGFGANDAGVRYEVAFDAAPSVWQVGSQSTSASDGLRFEILRFDGVALASFTSNPGAWPGGASAQNSFNSKSFAYVGDGSGDVRIRLSTEPDGTVRFGGAIDDLRVGVLDEGVQPFSFISPSAGETYEIGSEQTVMWTGGADTWDVVIRLIDVSLNQIVLTIAPQTSNNGVEAWTIPEYVEPGEYRLYVQNVPGTQWAYGQNFNVVAVDPTGHRLARPRRAVQLDRWTELDERRELARGPGVDVVWS